MESWVMSLRRKGQIMRHGIMMKEYALWNGWHYLYRIYTIELYERNVESSVADYEKHIPGSSLVELDSC